MPLSVEIACGVIQPVAFSHAFKPVQDEDDKNSEEPSFSVERNGGRYLYHHGFARLYYWSVPDFGGFLAASGLPFGLVLAWTITVGEILSGSLLILGKYVRYCVLFHATVILAGIFMVHLQNGWFVVGHGANGIEYSVLLLVALFTVYRGEFAATT